MFTGELKSIRSARIQEAKLKFEGLATISFLLLPRPTPKSQSFKEIPE